MPSKVACFDALHPQSANGYFRCCPTVPRFTYLIEFVRGGLESRQHGGKGSRVEARAQLLGYFTIGLATRRSFKQTTIRIADTFARVQCGTRKTC